MLSHNDAERSCLQTLILWALRGPQARDFLSFTGLRLQKYMVVTHVICWITLHFIPYLLKWLVLSLLSGNHRWIIFEKCNWIQRSGAKHEEVSVVENHQGMETLLPRGSCRFITGDPGSRGICLNILGWRIKCSALWEGSWWDSLLEGQQYVFNLCTSSWGSYVFMVILDIKLSVLLLIRISFRIKGIPDSRDFAESCWNYQRFTA